MVEYHYRDKISGKLVRKRFYLNRIVNSYLKKSDGINHARRIVHELNEKTQKRMDSDIRDRRPTSVHSYYKTS